MKRMPSGYIIPSAAFTLPISAIKQYDDSVDKKPEVGDVILGRVSVIGQHDSLENRHGRSHRLAAKRRAIFVLGNRYAPDAFEAEIPDKSLPNELDILAKSGVVGVVKNAFGAMKLPTKIKVMGYLLNPDGTVLNTRQFCKINPTQLQKGENRAKLILLVGTQMNSGKSTTASACCWALSNAGYKVRASKVTGTASLRDILSMEDHGASSVHDFSSFGFPSTYLLDEKDVLRIFNNLDLKYTNNPKNYWVVEIADGILQRETAMLLQSPDVKNRIHRLIFTARDALGALGGLEVLSKRFQLTPNAISGVIGSSPLAVRELSEFTKIPVVNSLNYNLEDMLELLL